MALKATFNIGDKVRVTNPSIADVLEVQECVGVIISDTTSLEQKLGLDPSPSNEADYMVRFDGGKKFGLNANELELVP